MAERNRRIVKGHTAAGWNVVAREMRGRQQHAHKGEGVSGTVENTKKICQGKASREGDVSRKGVASRAGLERAACAPCEKVKRATAGLRQDQGRSGVRECVSQGERRGLGAAKNPTRIKLARMTRAGQNNPAKTSPRVVLTRTGFRNV